jgi:hypothetical protein
MTESTSAPEPILQVDPLYLNLGTLDPQQMDEVPLTTTLSITNIGGGLLVGRVVPQVHWIQVVPQGFHVTSGESSEHHISLTPKAPLSPEWHTYNFDNLVFINSKQGPRSIGGTYLCAPRQPSQRAVPRWAYFALPALLILMLVFLVFGALSLRLNNPAIQAADRNTLLTQGAQTIAVQLTFTAAANQSSPIAPTPLLPKDAPVISLATPSDPLSGTSNPSEPTATFTPWPKDTFPNPEEFVHEYYRAINDQHYNLTWLMLSPNFQESCCTIAGNDPYTVYASWWNGVEEVEVLWAYLQDWSANPAIVNANLRYHFKRGEVIEGTHIFKLVANQAGSGLLIDEVQ